VLVLRDAVEGERKDVSVVIVDVAGSLAMADTLDPEDIHAIMDGLFALALEAVHAEGGTLNQFRGDGFMALFGAPHARGDDAARALRAALEIRDRARRYGESVRARYDVPFAVRIGVNTGEVWVGAIGRGARRDYTAEGPTVGLAARLEAAAAPGQVLVGPGTVTRCGGHFELVDRGMREMRGLAEPVQVHELVREGAHQARFDLEIARGLGPFVAREDELRRLSLAFDPNSRIRVVEVRGEAGAGKSRLVLEALQRLPRHAAILHTTCREPDSRRAYVPWLGLFRNWPAELPGAHRIDTLVERIEGRRGPPPDPNAVAQDLAGALNAAANGRTLIVFLDDIQWLDPTSRDLLTRLAGELLDHPIRWLATMREDGKPEWSADCPVERISLGSLAPGDAAELAQHVLTGVHRAADLAELACKRGGGNALLVEEVARALRDGGEAAQETARLEVSVARSRNRIPENLQGVVAARIDALPEDAKQLLTAAAVIGSPVSADLLRAIQPNCRDLDAQLRVLFERDLLRPNGSSGFDFCHGLIEDGAYAQLVRARRQGLHRLSAEALAPASNAKTPAGASRIATHWDRAGEPEPAAKHYLAAGEGYLRLRAFAEGVAHLRRGIALLGEFEAEPSVVVDASLQLATALNALDRAGEATAVLEAIHPRGTSPEDRRRIAQADIQGAWACFSEGGDAARARALLHRALVFLEDLEGTGELRLLAHSHLSRIELMEGATREAIRHARCAVECASGRGEPVALALALYHESAALRSVGQTEESQRTVERMGELRATGPSPYVVALCEVARAEAFLAAGELEAALAAASRGEEAAESAGQIGFRYNAMLTRSKALLLRGELREANEIARELATLHDGWASTRAQLARTSLEVGDLDSARAEAERGLADNPPRGMRACLQAVLGLVLGLGGDPVRGEELLLEAVSTLDACGLRPALAEAHGFMAELMAEIGDSGRAGYYAERSISAYRDCGMPAHAEHVRQALAAPASGNPAGEGP